MKRHLIYVLALALATVMFGCKEVSSDEYVAQKPVLNLKFSAEIKDEAPNILRINFGGLPGNAKIDFTASLDGFTLLTEGDEPKAPANLNVTESSNGFTEVTINEDEPDTALVLLDGWVDADDGDKLTLAYDGSMKEIFVNGEDVKSFEIDVTNNVIGAVTETDIEDVILKAEQPNITKHPASASYRIDSTPEALTVTVASVTEGTHYKWYESATEPPTEGPLGGTQVGSDQSSYTPSATALGTKYYYVVVTNTNDEAQFEKTVSVNSNVAVINVTAVFPDQIKVSTFLSASQGRKSATEVDSEGNMYVTRGSGIVKISAGTTTDVLFAGNIDISDAVKGYKDSDNGGEARFRIPHEMVVDKNGNVYVADEYNNCIRKITKTGAVSTFAGLGDNEDYFRPEGPGKGAGHYDGTGTAARFYLPWGMAIDSEGNLFVSEYGNHCIRKITPQGDVTTVAGFATGIAGGQFVDDKGAAARFNLPKGLDIDKAGNLYVADSGNHRIRKIDKDGNVSTLAGSSLGFEDGVGPAANFNQPTGVAVDIDGFVYVTDHINNRIRKITPAGVVSTLAGTGIQGVTDGIGAGIGAVARFNRPVCGAMDNRTGYLYVVTHQNQTVRKLTPQ
jgi:hypothetical protein